MKSSWWMFWETNDGCCDGFIWTMDICRFSRRSLFCKNFSAPLSTCQVRETEGVNGDKTVGHSTCTHAHRAFQSPHLSHTFDFICSLSLSLSPSMFPFSSSRCLQLVIWCQNCGCQGKSSSSSLMRVLKLSTSLPGRGGLERCHGAFGRLKLRWENHYSIQ